MKNMLLTDPQWINDLLLSKEWFDHTLEMNAILNTLHERIFNLEITLQANNQITNRSHTLIGNKLASPQNNTIIRQNQLAQELIPNSIDTISQRSTRNVAIPDQHLTLGKQLGKSNLSSHVYMEQTVLRSMSSPHTIFSSTSNPLPSPSSELRILPSLNLTPKQMKTRAYELGAIFEDAFDQLNIIHDSLSTNKRHQKNNNPDQFPSDDSDAKNVNSNCSPFALNLAGISLMNDDDKFRYEIRYFFRLLMLLFRALLLDAQTDLSTAVEKTHHDLPSKELIDLTNRLKDSQDQISQLSFVKKHFHTEKSEQLNILRSTSAQLKDRLMEEKSRAKIAFRYCDDWKKNHILQWIQMLLQTEQDYTKTIRQYERNLKQAEITYQETIKILIQQRNELKANADKWYEQYQNETGRFERELTDFRYEFKQMKKQREDMHEEYQRMQIVVDEFNQMKANERLLLEKQKLEEEAVKRIQAWWRGTMTRRIKQKKRKKKKRR